MTTIHWPRQKTEQNQSSSDPEPLGSKIKKKSNSAGQIDHLRVLVVGETGCVLDRAVYVVATSRCHNPSAAYMARDSTIKQEFYSTGIAWIT